MSPRDRGRGVEDVGFLVAILLVLLYGAAEAAAHVGLVRPVPAGATCPPPVHSLPWALVLSVFALVLPKTIGRASAGRIWELLVNVVERWLARRPPPGPPDESRAG